MCHWIDTFEIGLWFVFDLCISVLYEGGIDSRSSHWRRCHCWTDLVIRLLVCHYSVRNTLSGMNRRHRRHLVNTLPFSGSHLDMNPVILFLYTVDMAALPKIVSLQDQFKTRFESIPSSHVKWAFWQLWQATQIISLYPPLIRMKRKRNHTYLSKLSSALVFHSCLK